MSGILFFTTEERERKLIVTVEKYPCIWDCSASSYANRYLKANAWESVAVECECPGNVEGCKRKWKGLKEKFMREKKKIKEASSVDGSKVRKPWALFNKMNFVARFVGLKANENIFSSGDQFNAQERKIENCLVSFPNEEDPVSESCCSPLLLSDDVTKRVSEGSQLYLTSGENVEHEPACEEGPNTVRTKKRKSMDKAMDILQEAMEDIKSYDTLLNDKLKLVMDWCKLTLEAGRDVGNIDKTTLFVADKESDATNQFFLSMALQAKKLPTVKRLKLQGEINNLLYRELKDYEMQNNTVLWD